MTDDVQAVAEALRQAAADPDSALGDCGPIAWTGKAGDEVTIIEGHVDEIAEVAVAALRARDSGDTVTVPRDVFVHQRMLAHEVGTHNYRVRCSLCDAADAALGQEGEQ